MSRAIRIVAAWLIVLSVVIRFRRTAATNDLAAFGSARQPHAITAFHVIPAGDSVVVDVLQPGRRVAVALVSPRCGMCSENHEQVVRALHALDADERFVVPTLGESASVLVAMGYPRELIANAARPGEVDSLRIGFVPSFFVLSRGTLELVWLGIPNSLQVWRRAILSSRCVMLDRSWGDGATILGVALAALAGCDPGTASDRVATTLNRELPYVTCGAYRTDLEPAVVISASGDEPASSDSPASRLGSIDAVRLWGEAGILIADQKRLQVHWIDSTGRYLLSVGQKGDGPGGLRSIGGLEVVGDGILVFDPLLRRITSFGTDGRVHETVDLAGRLSSRLARIQGVFSDGSLLVSEPLAPVRGNAGVQRDRIVLRRMTASGTTVDEFGEFLGTERYVDSQHGLSVELLPFGKRGSFRVARDRIVVATGDSDVVRLLGLPRDGEQSLALPTRATRVSEAEKEEYIDHASRSALVPSETRRLLGQLPFPIVKAPYEGITADRLGLLWVDLSLGPRLAPHRYIVMDLSGRVVEELLLEAGVEVLDADGKRVVTRVTDEAGRQSLAIHPRHCTHE